jgi:hypothetical protein
VQLASSSKHRKGLSVSVERQGPNINVSYRIGQPAINATPPMGVTAPSIATPVAASTRIAKRG